MAASRQDLVQEQVSELLERSANGLTVRVFLEKEGELERLWLEVTDRGEPAMFVEIPGDKVMHAFEHPFLYDAVIA